MSASDSGGRALIKRALDISSALIGLLCLWPVFLVIAVLIKRDSQGPVFFRQDRIGKDFRPFRMYKFRTMVGDGLGQGSQITAGDDPRITRVGYLLRRLKLDELPQLINVLRGEMSLVGPRPEVPQYVEVFRADYEEILSVRPGMTDWASLAFRDEAAILGGSANPEEMYMRIVLPAKLELGREYVRRASLAGDVTVIVQTLMALCRSRPPAVPLNLRRRDEGPPHA